MPFVIAVGVLLIALLIGVALDDSKAIQPAREFDEVAWIAGWPDHHPTKVVSPF
jgi:hypothetical protein